MSVTMQAALAKTPVSNTPLHYEHSCLVKASAMLQSMFEAVEKLPEDARKDWTLDLANLADQISDAECGLRRHLGLSEPGDDK